MAGGRGATYRADEGAQVGVGVLAAGVGDTAVVEGVQISGLSRFRVRASPANLGMRLCCAQAISPGKQGFSVLAAGGEYGAKLFFHQVSLVQLPVVGGDRGQAGALVLG
jgi:hypothetical protein